MNSVNYVEITIAEAVCRIEHLHLLLKHGLRETYHIIDLAYTNGGE